MEDYNKEYYWEFYLRDNPLTKDNTKDCIAEVKTGPKTLTKEDTAREIKRTGSELKLPTILSVTSQDSDIILEALLNGDSVITDLCQFSPRILGAFDNPDAQFDPAIHKLTFDIIPTKKLRDALKNVKVINMGAKADVARISDHGLRYEKAFRQPDRRHLGVGQRGRNAVNRNRRPCE